MDLSILPIDPPTGKNNNKYSLYAIHGSEPCFISFNLHDNPIREVLLFLPDEETEAQRHSMSCPRLAAELRCTSRQTGSRTRFFQAS